MNNFKTLLVTSAFALALVFLNDTVAKAQSVNNTVHACYQRSNGQLRRVAGLNECRPSEIHLSWNIRGPEGAKGDKGDPGVVDTSNFFTKIESNQRFIRGNGIMSAGSADIPRFSLTPIFSIPGQLEVFGACSTGQSDLVIHLLDGSWAAFFNTGKVRIFTRELTTNFSIGNTDATNGERFFLQLTKNDGGPTVTMDGSAAFGNPCFIQWTATVINHQ